MSLKVLVLLITLCHLCRGEDPKKREIFEYGNFGLNFPIGHQYDHLVSNDPLFSAPTTGLIAKPIWKSFRAISSGEIAAAITAAKEANVQVMEAQRRVQLAKESVIHRQRIANQKESDAALQMQKAEALAAAARQEANAAATSVVLAQQRLAQAKSEVAEQQRVAAEKEAHAAAVIHKSASAAAVEIQRKEDTATKLAALQKSQTRAALKHVSDSKDDRLTATSAAVAVSSSNGAGSHNYPWANGQKAFYVPHWV